MERKYRIACAACGKRTWSAKPYDCPACGSTNTSFRELDAKRGNGRCDGNCWHSDSLKCRCACGGANHGEGWRAMFSAEECTPVHLND